MHTRSFVKLVSLEEISKHRREIESSCFTLPESPSTLRLQTLAGIVCVKRAVGAALGSIGLQTPASEKDVIIGHDSCGKPIVLEMAPDASGKLDALCISLTHTRDHAWGCAVFREDAANG